MSPIYLDNNATTLIHPEVTLAMAECYRSGLANPASPHYAGRRARRVVEAARTGIAELLGAKTTGMDADRLILTSGGTEANNLAILGLLGRRPGRLIVSKIEHPSVVAAADAAARLGHEVVGLAVDQHGVVLLDQLHEWLGSDTRLASIMLGNNETGVLQPVQSAAEICRLRGTLLHTDAVQCVGKIPVHFRQLDVDALTVSAHKFHGPTGIGALLVRPGVTIEPRLFGGFQQAGIRPGTESAALAVGIHRALLLWQQEMGERIQRLTRLRDQLELGLRQACPEALVNGEAAPRLPHTTSIGFPGLDRQALVMALDLAEIACSTGSACASGSSERSPVLLAMNVSASMLDASIRLSVSAQTTFEEIAEAIQRISRVVKDLQRQRIQSRRLPTPPNPSSAPV